MMYPGLREPQTEAAGGGGEKIMVLRVPAVGLQNVVVDVLHGQFGVCAAESQRLELKHDMGSGRVLGAGKLSWL
ncbi:hypothetical protein NG698_18635 [Pseudarthrobacter sp. MDT3-9]|nr:hypothetical protein [Pseudarthrobacter sp. MDT3-9]